MVTDGKRLTYQADKRNIKKGLEIKYFVPVDTAEMDPSSFQQDDQREGEVVEAGAEPPRVQSVQMTEIKYIYTLALQLAGHQLVTAHFSFSLVSVENQNPINTD